MTAGTIALVAFFLILITVAVWLGLDIARVSQAIERGRQERDEEI